MNCYVLIGGASRRMGRPKASLDFQGETFAEIVTRAAGDAFDRVLGVQRHDGTAWSGATIYEEPAEVAAPVHGVLTALRHAQDRCFILAIDYPMITSQLLRDLRERFSSSPAPMLVPIWRGRPQMLCAGYDPALIPLIQKRIAQGQLDLRGLIEACSGEIIPEAELRGSHRGEPLMNVNTPEELKEARQIDER